MTLTEKEQAMVISTFFSEAEVTQVAYQTNFVQRSGSKLSGLIFLQAFVFACLEHSRVSLSKIAQSCLDLGVVVSAQAIDQRLGLASVAFVQQMFLQAMLIFVNRLALPLPLIAQFSGLNLIDSSIIPLSDKLAPTYPGSGGNGPKASLKVRLVFDFLYQAVRQLSLTPGRQSDKGSSDYLRVIQPGSLTITDLGYFNLDNFAQIERRSAYFLSRYQSGTSVFDPTGQAIDLLSRLAGQNVTDQAILVGRDQRLPCRLVAFELKQEIADQRRRRAQQAAKRRGKTLRPTTLALLTWSIYLTNVPEPMLTPAQVALLYRVRWQIELVFKLCKSYCGLRSLAHLRAERLLTELYARMIGLLLLFFLMAPLRLPTGAEAKQELSLVQARLIGQRFARDLHQCLAKPAQVAKLLTEFRTHLVRFGGKNKRKSKPNLCRALALSFGLVEVQFSLEQEVEVLALSPV